MSNYFTDGQREAQERVDTRRLADGMAEAVSHDTISDREYIEEQFARVLDEHTVAFPIYDGNGM